MGLEPIAKFSCPGPSSIPCHSLVQCEYSCIIYRNPFSLSLSRPGSMKCERAIRGDGTHVETCIYILCVQTYHHILLAASSEDVTRGCSLQGNAANWQTDILATMDPLLITE